MRNVFKRTIAILLATTLVSSLFASSVIAFAATDFLDESSPETDGILIEFDTDTLKTMSCKEEEDPEDELRDIGLEVTDKTETSDGSILITAEPVRGQSVEEAVKEAEALPNVTSAQPNYIYWPIEDVSTAQDAENADSVADEANAENNLQALSISQVNDPYAQTSSASSTYNQYWLYSASFPEAWQTTTCDNNVTIAVLDASIMASHEDLNANILEQYAWDAANNEPLNMSTADPTANNGHGTHVAGIVSATANNAKGIAGGSFNANILPVRVFDDSGKSSTKALRVAYDYMMSLQKNVPSLNLRVINMSLGSYNASAFKDGVLQDCIKQMRNTYDAVTVCAGGNGTTAGEPNTDTIYPSDFEECVSVTSLQSDGTNAYWSDYNMNKDISTSGVSILSTYPAAKNSYKKMSGTSMSAAIVSAAFALMFSAVPDATVNEACQAMYTTATPIKDTNNDRTRISGSHGALDVASAVEWLVSNHVKRYADVSESDWFYEAVVFANNKGIMTGYDDGTNRFGPDDPTLREQAAAILYRYIGDGRSTSAAKNSDVKQSEWYASAVNWAANEGIMIGYDNGAGLFGVGDSLTREQFAKIIAIASGADINKANPSKFLALEEHEDTSDWAYSYMVWAVDAGIINGVSSTYLNPQGEVTRAQIAQIMMNAIENGVL